ncbi:MAG: hypothetical protein K6U00_10090, partial [Armatimonadetes bacterium]|nr:hypothetical protein [Armatimonadota bacterium]
TIIVPRGSIDPGQQAVPISMTIENTAIRDVFVESASLSFWQGSTDVSNYFTVTPNAGNPSVIRGNQTAVFNFTVDVSPSVPLGQSTVHGSAKGILNLKANGSFEKDASIPEGTGPTDWEWLAGYPADDYYMSYQHQQSYGNVAPIPDTATKLTFRWIAAWSSTGTDNKKQGFKLYMKNPAGGGWKLRMEIHCMSSRLYFQLAKGTPSVPGWLYYFTPLQYYQIEAWLRASDGHFEVTITPLGGSGTIGFCSGTAAPESDTPTVQWGNMYASGTNEMWAKEASYAVEENGVPPQGWTVSWSAFDGRVPDDPSLPTSKRWNLEDGNYGPPYEQIVASAPWSPPSHFAVEQVDVKEGTRALKLWYAPNQSNPEGYVSTGSGALLPRISVSPGTTYTASFWYKIISYGLNTANYRLRMLWEEYDSAGRPYFRRGTDPFFHDAEPVPVVTGSWQKVTYTFTTTQWTTSCMAYLDLIKVGDGGGGLVIYFDDFRLYNANGYVDADADTPGTLTIGSAQPVSSVQGAKALGDGVVISLSQAIVTGKPIGEPTVFNIESDDRESGIRVVKSGHGMDVGMRASIIGTLRTSADGERYIEATSVIAAGTGTVDPLMLPNRELGGGSWVYNPATGAGQKGVKDAVGLNNIGLLVTITGRVTYRGIGYFYIDDGSAIADPSGHVGVKVICTGLDDPQSDYVKVTGFSSCYKLGSDLHRLIRVRGAADIVEYAE